MAYPENNAINAIIQRFLGNGQNYISPLPQNNKIVSPIQSSNVLDANIRMQAGIGKETNIAPSPITLALAQIKQAYDATLPIHSAHRIKEAVQQQQQANAEAPIPTPTLAPNATDFEKQALPIINAAGIPPSVAFGMAAAEGGKIGSNNVYNINATDSNPQGANNYATIAEAVQHYADLIKNDPRYAKAYAVRNNPDKMLEEIMNAGYAGDPKTWRQRSIQTGGAGQSYGSYKDFVMDTPAYKRYIQQP